MPLLDHFHPPLSVTHPWKGFHSAWANAITNGLNEALPEGYYAATDRSGPPVPKPLRRCNGAALLEAAFAILDKAAGQGVNFIDTADAYPVPPTPETVCLGR